MAETREILLDWLRDAYAMEQMSIEILEKQARRLEHYPQMQQRVQQHVDESRSQAEQLKGLVKQMGDDISSVKSGLGSMMGNFGAIFNAGTPDEVIKNSIGDFAVENFEIASYRALIGAAKELGEMNVQRVCEQILQQEEAMASFLQQNLPMITQEFLQRQQTGEPAKR